MFDLGDLDGQFLAIFVQLNVLVLGEIDHVPVLIPGDDRWGYARRRTGNCQRTIDDGSRLDVCSKFINLTGNCVKNI